MTQAPPAAATPAAPAYVDTPALLNRWSLIGVVTVVVFGLLSALVQFLSWQADGRAADETAQLVRVRGIESSLLRADALSTNGYLTAGLESTDRQHAYVDAIDDVLKQIADAAEAQPADRDALAALNQKVEAYASDVSQAAVYNRQGLPLGIAYQTSASDELRSDALPIVRALIDANSQRSEDAMGGQHPWWLLLIGVLAFAVLVWINQEMAKAFRRRVNPGLAIAAAIILITTLVTAVAAFAHAHGNAKTRDGAYRDAVAAATARTAANDAKANESLRLINRGSGGDYEDKWEAARKSVDGVAGAETADTADWTTYVKRHQEIVRLDEGNKWRQAVVEATTADRTGSTAPLDGFDAAMKAQVSRAADRATSELSGGRAIELLLALLTALLGMVAAVMVTRGIGARRREFL